MIIGCAGTFNRVHKGHLELIRTMCDIVHPGDLIIVGITTDEFAKSTRSVNVRPYNDRLNSIKHELEYAVNDKGYSPMMFDTLSEYYTSQNSKAWVVNIAFSSINSLNDSLAMGEDICDYVVVSTESLPRAERMLAHAEEGKGKPSLIVVPCILNKNGKKLSSTDIIESDADGE